MFHVDQVPLVFEPSPDQSLTTTGLCARTETEHNDDKRMVTLQVTICAEPSPFLVRVEFIFSGRPVDISLTDSEEEE